MSTVYNLQRFADAQQRSYASALAEVKQGKKRSHWMWYIFPQIQGLGFSETAKYYAIENIDEAAAFLQHPVLGSRLVEICNALIGLNGNNASTIFGYPDDVKLQSSITLFAAVPGAHPAFEAVLNKFFNGAKDQNTLRILERQQKNP